MLSRSLDGPRRAALAVFAERASPSRHDQAIDWIHGQPAKKVVQALADDQVDQLFLHRAQTGGLATRLPAKVIELLTARRMSVAVGIMRQEHMLGQATALLDEMGADYVVFKGALVRQMLYAKPYLRPSADVDLLVAADMAPRVARTFEQRGYAVAAAAHSDTHEVWIERQGVGLDLHWRLMRHGRMRQDLTAEILANRVRRGNLWGPSDTHLTVMMLVHPAITDHVTGRLISAVDLDLWLRSQEIPWPSVIEILDRIGLKTAAWAMLTWTCAILGTPVPAEVMRALSPSPLRQRYLQSWLRHHPAALYWRQPWLVRGAFSLALQDRATDAVRALWMLAKKERLVL